MTDDKFSHSGVTHIAGTKDSKIPPLMSYTAVKTHNEMALSLVNHLLAHCNQIMPDAKLSIEDLIAICNVALNKQEEGISLIEGKYLRGRISEQLSRTRRYGEPFAMLAIKLKAGLSDSSYDAILDVLRERLRKSDLVFTFKNRIMLILPHIDKGNTKLLIKRIKKLIDATFKHSPIVDIPFLPFPSPEIKRSSQVLDWAEDQLR